MSMDPQTSIRAFLMAAHRRRCELSFLRGEDTLRIDPHALMARILADISRVTTEPTTATVVIAGHAWDLSDRIGGRYQSPEEVAPMIRLGEGFVGMPPATRLLCAAASLGRHLCRRDEMDERVPILVVQEAWLLHRIGDPNYGIRPSDALSIVGGGHGT